MFKNGYLGKLDLVSKKIPINIKKRTNSEFNERNYYYEEIRKNLYSKYGKNKLYSDGLIIKSSINTKLQKLADKSLLQGLIDYDKRQGWNGPIDNLDFENFKLNSNKYASINPSKLKWFPVRVDSISKQQILIVDTDKNLFEINFKLNENKWLKDIKFREGDIFFVELINSNVIIRQVPTVNGAIVVIDPHNGDVLAMSGGISFLLSEFNRATQAKRQPGSAFKPFVYISALKEGYTPSTLILDAPYVIDQGPGLPKWKPANYTDEFYGLTTMRTGIEKSRNLMTIRLANNIGIEKILKTIEDFGISEINNEHLSMALGSGEVSLLELTNSYAIIANGGKKIEPKLIKSIYSKEGLNIFNSSQKCLNCKLSVLSEHNNLPSIVSNKKNILDENSLSNNLNDGGCYKKRNC